MTPTLKGSDWHPELGPHGSHGGDFARGRDELAVLKAINQAVLRHRELGGLLEAVAVVFETVLPATHVAVAVAAPAGPSVSIYGLPGARKLDPQCIPYGPLSEWVAANRRALVISSHGQACERFPETCQDLIDAGVASLVVLPLLVDDRFLGTLGLMSAAERAWNHYSPQLLDSIGTSVVAALDNCLAYEQSQSLGNELKALLDVNIAVGRHLRRDELFGALARCLRDLLEIDRFGIELPIEGDRLQGHLLTPRGAESEPTRVKILPAQGTACNWVLQNRQWLVSSTRDELRQRFPLTFEVMCKEGMESLCAMPLVVEGRARGVMFFMAGRKQAYGNLRRGLFEQVAGAAAVALDDCLAHEEVRRLRDQLAAENVYLQEEIHSQHHPDEIVGQSPLLAAVFADIERVAPNDTTVLITGETGTGKELVARAIHSKSPRRDRPLIKVSCAALPADLVESELFGHEKGAFTGALARRVGRFELAAGGTIFLDEVGDVPLATQTKLLRVLQEREFERIGSSVSVKVDVRVIAATNRDLRKAVDEGSFRQDLFYRLNVFPIQLPPLRARHGDIPLLVHYLVAKLSRKLGRPITGFTKESMDRLTRYSWPGNVRELENVLERAIVLSRHETLEIPTETLSLPAGPRVASPPPAPPASLPDALPRDLESVERAHIVGVLTASSWIEERLDLTRIEI